MTQKYDSPVPNIAQEFWDATSDAALKEKAHRLGERLTGGPGSDGYMITYLKELQHSPMWTKMATSFLSTGLQEYIASAIAQDKSKHGNYANTRTLNMALYGGLVSAPLGSFLINCLERMFRGKTSLRANILQVVISNGVISPIQTCIYIFALSLIHGARTWHQVKASLHKHFWWFMRVNTVASICSLAVAQRYVAEKHWLPFFNFVGFVVGIICSYHEKKARLNALMGTR
ncbi:hypothetical protein KEM55_002164, partial [Ascosphaera atra]